MLDISFICFGSLAFFMILHILYDNVLLKMVGFLISTHLCHNSSILIFITTISSIAQGYET